jgi:hypothetical protein
VSAAIDAARHGRQAIDGPQPIADGEATLSRTAGTDLRNRQAARRITLGRPAKVRSTAPGAEENADGEGIKRQHRACYDEREPEERRLTAQPIGERHNIARLLLATSDVMS